MLETSPSSPLAELIALTYATDGVQLVDCVSTRLPAHGVTAIIGANGAGKTTLLRLLAGLLQPTSGTLTWNRPHRSALVFQRPVILRRGVEANIRHALSTLKLTRTEVEQRIEQALATCRLESMRHAPARRLSGGEQQRLALARALAREPETLLLDEPCASLDPQSTAAIETIVRNAALGGTSVLLVTHDIAQAQRLADTVLFLHAGKLIEQAPAVSFFNKPAAGQARDYLAGRLPEAVNGEAPQ